MNITEEINFLIGEKEFASYDYPDVCYVVKRFLAELGDEQQQVELMLAHGKPVENDDEPIYAKIDSEGVPYINFVVQIVPENVEVAVTAHKNGQWDFYFDSVILMKK